MNYELMLCIMNFILQMNELTLRVMNCILRMHEGNDGQARKQLMNLVSVSYLFLFYGLHFITPHPSAIADTFSSRRRLWRPSYIFGVPSRHALPNVIGFITYKKPVKKMGIELKKSLNENRLVTVNPKARMNQKTPDSVCYCIFYTL